VDNIFANSYLQDQIIPHSEVLLIGTNGSFKQHIETLGKALAKLHQDNLQVRADTLSVAKQEIEFLGTLWHSGKLNIVRQNFRIQKHSCPKHAKETQSSLRSDNKLLPFHPKIC
jgi:hypothetical protein